jgi:hypothetical protein
VGPESHEWTEAGLYARQVLLRGRRDVLSVEVEMSVSGKMWAELAWIARRDAAALRPDPYGQTKLSWQEVYAQRSLSPGDRAERERADEAEAVRLDVLAERFAYRARELGFTQDGTDYVFGDRPQGPFKQCGNCPAHYVYEYQWQELPLCGTQDFPEEDLRLELRNCTCGSTLAVEMEISCDASSA